MINNPNQLKNATDWYVAYTRSRAERIVERQFAEKGIEPYLPIIKTLRQWSDRKKIVEEPIFKSYVFFRGNRKDFYNAYYTHGVIRLLQINGKPVKVSQAEIDLVKKVANGDYNVSVIENAFTIGDRVVIKKGCLAGIMGLLVNFRGKYKVAIAIDSLLVSMLVEVPLSYISKIS